MIAAGDDLIAIVREVAASGGHPFVARVGGEETPFRIRRAEFVYDKIMRSAAEF